MKKLISSVLITSMLFIIFILPINAQTDNILWINTYSVEIAHDYITGGSAECLIRITGYSGTTSIDNVDIKLSRKISSTTWVSVATWNDLSASGTTFTFFDTADNVLPYYTYRLSFTAEVHRNGTTEYLNQYSDVYYS
jgi:hypothetical protein